MAITTKQQRQQGHCSAVHQQAQSVLDRKAAWSCGINVQTLRASLEVDRMTNDPSLSDVFTLTTTNINLSLAITGDSKKSEKVEGTDGDDLIADGRGKDKLIGGDGADQFYFSGEEPFKKRKVDKVIDFDASEGDKIVIADEVFGGLTKDPTLAIAYTKKQLKSLSKEGYDLIYFEPKGDLYVDGNGDSRGFGKKSEGGMIADLPRDTILTESDVLIGV